MSEEKINSPSLEEIKLANEYKIKEKELSIAEQRLNYEMTGRQSNLLFVLVVMLFAILAVFGGWMLFRCVCESPNQIKKYADDEPDRLAMKQEGASLLPVFYKSNSSTELPHLVGLDGQACVGKIQLSAGLMEVQNPSLLREAQKSSGIGGVCFGKVFSVISPIIVYRVYNSSDPQKKLGDWWSLSPPAGSKEEYRTANAICPGWSTLDRLIKCELRPGSEVVVGTTQSVDCKDGPTYPKTGENQVYIANSGEDQIYHVGACTEAAIW